MLLQQMSYGYLHELLQDFNQSVAILSLDLVITIWFSGFAFSISDLSLGTTAGQAIQRTSINTRSLTSTCQQWTVGGYEPN